jgi:hypothetical protein
MRYPVAKEYLGDGVYVEEDVGLGLVLTTENGIRATNTITLEPEVWRALVRYVDRIREAERDANPPHVVIGSAY